jgi:hypothetical protein
MTAMSEARKTQEQVRVRSARASRGGARGRDIDESDDDSDVGNEEDTSTRERRACARRPHGRDGQRRCVRRRLTGHRKERLQNGDVSSKEGCN